MATSIQKSKPRMRLFNSVHRVEYGMSYEDRIALLAREAKEKAKAEAEAKFSKKAELKVAKAIQEFMEKAKREAVVKAEKAEREAAAKAKREATKIAAEKTKLNVLKLEKQLNFTSIQIAEFLEIDLSSVEKILAAEKSKNKSKK